MRLEAKNLSFSYDVKGRQILRQFSLSADSSERVGIIAPSGFGKTTLCKILSGYEAPQSGEVLLDGKPLSEYGAYCPIQMIWQHPEQAGKSKTPHEKCNRRRRQDSTGTDRKAGNRT